MSSLTGSTIVVAVIVFTASAGGALVIERGDRLCEASGREGASGSCLPDVLDISADT